MKPKTENSKTAFRFRPFVVFGYTFLLCAGVALAQPPMPGTKVYKPATGVTKGSGALSLITPAAVIIPPPTKYLRWGFAMPMPAQGYRFEVHRANVPAGPFILFATTNSPPVAIPPGFYIARTYDMNSGLYSVWNQKR